MRTSAAMRVELSGHKFEFPQECACCGAAPQTTLLASASRSTGREVVHTTSKSWDFPYCARCAKHVQDSKGATMPAWSIIVCSIILAIIVGFNAPLIWAFLVAIVGIAGGVAAYKKLMTEAKRGCVPNCSSVQSAVTYSGWQGTRHTFDIASTNYATKFMVANRSKLVNVTPEVWEWLKANGYVASPNQPQSARRDMR